LKTKLYRGALALWATVAVSCTFDVPGMEPTNSHLLNAIFKGTKSFGGNIPIALLVLIGAYFLLNYIERLGVIYRIMNLYFLTEIFVSRIFLLKMERSADS